MPVRARILSIENLSAAVRRIRLEAPEFSFVAGQYLTVRVDQQRVPFSIASAPGRLPELELHYRSTPGQADAMAMDAVLASARELTLDGPAGEIMVSHATASPLNLIAGGTGIAQAAGILEHLSDCGQHEPVWLLWSLAADEPGYPIAAIENARDRSWFDFEQVSDDPSAEHNAAIGRIRARLAVDGEFLLCGGPGFVYAVADALSARAVSAERVRSDVFSYAPRPRA